MGNSVFTPLRVHSHGSLLYGVASPEALVARALETGCAALALTDRDNLYLAIAFWKAARAEGLRPLLGALLTPAPDARAAARGHEALLLGVDRRGYAHLCALVTRRMLEPRFDPVAAFAAEPGLASGLHIVVESPGLAASLLAAGVPAARGARDDGPRTGGDGGLWLGVRGLARERLAIAARAAAARELGVPLVATGDCVLTAARDAEAHRAAVTAAAGELLDRMPGEAFAAPDAAFVSPAAWDARVRRVCAAAAAPHAATEALANNRALAARCRLELDLGVPIFPRAPRPDGVAATAHLRALCDAGLVRRYPDHADRPAARRRLATELAIIERMEFTDYFLLVADIVRFARERGIPNVGRGSGASSIVAYALGITSVDPVRYGLAFERFLHPARRDCPDLDIDLCWWRRDEVIAHVYETYGHDRVAMISTHATLGARSAFRETAKALGVPNARVNALAKAVPRELAPPYREQLRGLTGAQHVDWDEPVLAQALALAERLDGAPRHLSVHSGGLVIADRPLTYYVPLEMAAKEILVTQFEMHAIESIGLVKIDLLGNRALSEIAQCTELVRARAEAAPEGCARSDATAGPMPVDPDRIPHWDAATVARLHRGDTLNCFQLESPAMRHLLRMLRPRAMDDVVAAVALIRPGAAGVPTAESRSAKETFCRRARGEEPPAYSHPRLEPVLRGTYGVLLYEEDVMRVAAALTGITYAEGDDLRRAIGHATTDEEFRALERGFVAQAARAGVDDATARHVWRELTRFAAYAFCKAHAAGYGALGWQTAYLKTHFPTEFAVGVLNHHAGMYATWVHVEDLRREGVAFRPPCVVRSEWASTLERDAGGTAAARVGLQRVFGLHEATAARVTAARREAPFASLADFTARVMPALPELESLALSGALDAFGRTRPSLLLEARAAAAAHGTARIVRRACEASPALAAPDGRPLAPPAVAPLGLPALPEYPVAERVHHECTTTGLWFSGHPLDALPRGVESSGVAATALERHAGRRVAITGMPCAWRRIETRSGGTMLFLTLADRGGLAECALFPDHYRRNLAALRGSILRAHGRVTELMGAVTLEVDRVEVVTPDTQPLPANDRGTGARQRAANGPAATSGEAAYNPLRERAVAIRR